MLESYAQFFMKIRAVLQFTVPTVSLHGYRLCKSVFFNVINKFSDITFIHETYYWNKLHLILSISVTQKQQQQQQLYSFLKIQTGKEHTLTNEIRKWLTQNIFPAHRKYLSGGYLFLKKTDYPKYGGSHRLFRKKVRGVGTRDMFQNWVSRDMFHILTTLPPPPPPALGTYMKLAYKEWELLLNTDLAWWIFLCVYLCYFVSFDIHLYILVMNRCVSRGCLI